MIAELPQLEELPRQTASDVKNKWREVVREVRESGSVAITNHSAVEVVLVNAKTKEKPDRARALAQSNLDGGGNTDARQRATSPLPTTNPKEPGRDLAEMKRRQRELEAQQQQLLAQARAARSAVATGSDGRNPSEEAAPQEAGRDMADRAHVRLHLSLSDDLPRIVAQEVQLQQMLLNVTINAIQQIQLLRPELGGNVLVCAALHDHDQRHVVRIQVEDDGPGIHRQNWQRIFDLGFTTRVEGGSGIGLYITHSLAETMGGRVSISSSEILWGTTFVIDLPLAA